MSEAQRVCGAAHILFHEQHAGGSFQVDASGVEADTFANDGDAGIALVAPGKVDQPRRACGTGRRADGMDEVKATAE